MRIFSTSAVMIAALMCSVVATDTVEAQKLTRAVAERRQRPGQGFWKPKTSSQTVTRSYSSGSSFFNRNHYVAPQAYQHRTFLNSETPMQPTVHYATPVIQHGTSIVQHGAPVIQYGAPVVVQPAPPVQSGFILQSPQPAVPAIPNRAAATTTINGAIR